MGYDPYYCKNAEGQGGYLRFGAFTMGFDVELMFDLGMAFQDGPPPRSFPNLPEGLSWEAVYAVKDPEDDPAVLAMLSDEGKPAATACLADVDKALKWHAQEGHPRHPCPRVPVQRRLDHPARQGAVRVWDWLCEKTRQGRDGRRGHREAQRRPG